MHQENYSSKPLFNPEYWDCNCVENYIHKKPKNYCPKCGATEINRPDSWTHEVEINFNSKEDSALYFALIPNKKNKEKKFH
jgi:hypothetical protein